MKAMCAASSNIKYYTCIIMSYHFIRLAAYSLNENCCNGKLNK